MCVNVFPASGVSVEIRWGHQIPCSRVTDGCEPPCRCWYWTWVLCNRYPTEISLCPHFFAFGSCFVSLADLSFSSAEITDVHCHIWLHTQFILCSHLRSRYHQFRILSLQKETPCHWHPLSFCLPCQPLIRSFSVCGVVCSGHVMWVKSCCDLLFLRLAVSWSSCGRACVHTSFLFTTNELL